MSIFGPHRYKISTTGKIAITKKCLFTRYTAYKLCDMEFLLG